MFQSRRAGDRDCDRYKVGGRSYFYLPSFNPDERATGIATPGRRLGRATSHLQFQSRRAGDRDCDIVNFTAQAKDMFGTSACFNPDERATGIATL